LRTDDLEFKRGKAVAKKENPHGHKVYSGLMQEGKLNATKVDASTCTVNRFSVAF